MTVKTMARRIGLNPSSNGQLTKTDLEAGGLAVRGFATGGLGLGPQRVPDGLGDGRARARDRRNFDAVIDDRGLGRRGRTSGSRRLFRVCRHGPNMAVGALEDKAISRAELQRGRADEARANPFPYRPFLSVAARCPFLRVPREPTCRQGIQPCRVPQLFILPSALPARSLD